MGVDAAGPAEAVLDDVLVEGVGHERVLALGEAHLAARDEPQRRALAVADRAVAHDGALDLAFHFVGDGAAVAASLVRHAQPSTGPRKSFLPSSTPLCRRML